MKCRVLVDGPRIDAWKRDCIELLRAGNEVEVRADAARRVTARRGEAWFKAFGGKALRGEEIAIDTNGRHEEEVDVVIDLRTNAMEASTEAAGRLGYWFFSEGDSRVLGSLPGASELAADSPTFTLELHCRTRAGTVHVLRTGRFKLLYSYARSMDIALDECKRWPDICLNVLSAHGKLPDCGTTRLPREGVPVRLADFGMRLLRGFLLQLYSYVFTDVTWKVGLIRAKPSSFLDAGYRPEVKWLHGPTQEFFADPFVFNLPGRRLVMGEVIDPATRKGYISCVEIETNGNTTAHRSIMRSGAHLSYPYVFRDRGKWYVVPECSEEGHISLYRAVDVPYKWERVATLIEGVAACDSTIFKYRGRWWLFCTQKSRDANLNLFAYYADDLLGPWKEHAANPIKTDIRSSRPAGMPFVSRGELYRPGQDCAIAYGDSIAFNRIVELNEYTYREELVSSFGGDGGSIFRSGSHTISYAGDCIAIDSKRTTFASPRLVVRRVADLCARLVTGRRAS
jgi:hypothetical protein